MELIETYKGQVKHDKTQGGTSANFECQNANYSA